MKTRLKTILLIAGAASVSAETVPLPEKIKCAVSDHQAFQQPDRVHFSGWVGSRIDANEQNRLVKLDPARLLEGYRKRPGRQTWDGEHVGKWLHAATLAWAYTGDAALREKLDYTVRELAKCQLEDGYLGTYLEKDRWTAWDVWAHKYNLIGLLTYMHFTGNTEPLSTCRRMADLLCNTFGDEPGKRDIIKAGEHVGMAPTSVLEPMVLLYRVTGEPRYLDFCRYILRAWEQPNGPHIISRLLSVTRVDKVGNAKAYEMLSCLNGALEYHRTMGDKPEILEACLNAWKDIVDNRLYITGASSYGELFRDDFDLPNVANVGETCVTVTWEQFNAQLLRLMGKARFAEQLEHVVLNQLFGAQKCDGSGWGYYVQMEGKKPYSESLDGHCCLSSGPRGVSLIPSFAMSTDAEGLVLNVYDAGKGKFKLADGKIVNLTIGTQYPTDGRIQIHVDPEQEQTFAVKLRVPSWCKSSEIKLNGNIVEPSSGKDGYLAIKRAWQKGDVIEMDLKLEPRLVLGDHLNEGKAALMYGPLVLAADESLLPGKSLSVFSFGTTDVRKLEVTPKRAPDTFGNCRDAQVYRLRATARRNSGTLKAGDHFEAHLIPFANAGSQGDRYRVWLPLGTTSEPANLLMDGRESRSREGNVTGSIVDDETSTFVVTFDDKSAAEDWYAVNVDIPIMIGRVVFAHGKNFHDGGWFDASGGKPRVQIQKVKDGPWETLGELSDYPATSSTRAAGLRESATFTLRLAQPVSGIGLRVVGKPASGDNPAQAFSSAAELQAFEK